MKKRKSNDIIYPDAEFIYCKLFDVSLFRKYVDVRQNKNIEGRMRNLEFHKCLIYYITFFFTMTN